MNQRTMFEEGELERMNVVTAQFCDDLARITAKALKQFSPDIRERVLAKLQDSTSLYMPCVSNAIEVHLENWK